MHKKLIRVASLLLTALLLLSIPAAVNAENIEETVYTVTLTEDSRVNYSGVSKLSFALQPGSYTNVYANIAEELEDDWYISDVAASPADAAEIVFYQNTGDILIKNITADLTLTPVVEVKTAPVKLDVGWEFPGGGIYDEGNAAATVEFTVKATDADGNPAVNAKLYYKSDVGEKSFTNALKTDLNGVAAIKHAYGLIEGEDEAAFTAQFATDLGFTELLEEVPFNVVLQKKTDLHLTTDQVKQSRPNNADGGVLGLDPLYEYFTGVLHQKAINTASGEWVTPENGVIEGLSPGQYALRFREHIEGDTIYLHSDYDYFTIERAIWTVKADTENTEHLTFADSELYASPGGDVFFYVTPDEGYRVADYAVTKPNYVSDIIYNEADGYIWLRGITGNFTLKVNAEEAQEPASAESAEPVVENVATSPVAKALRATALSAAASGPRVEILDVYQNIDATDEGTQIAVKYKVYGSDGNPVNVTSSTATLKFKLSTAANYSNAAARNFTAGEETGEASSWFSVSASTSAARIYDVYVDYNGTESEHITLNLEKKPSINKNNFSVVNAKGDRENGKIIYTGGNPEYNSFLYHKQGQSDKLFAEGTTISGLEHGTWYVYVPAAFAQTDETTYAVRVRSSSASISVGQDDDDGSAEIFTVSFKNAAGEIVSSVEYEEGTRASAVAKPANTAGRTEGNKVYTYTWPAVSDVTADVIYEEIETVTTLNTATVIINDITQNPSYSTGDRLSLNLSITGDNGAAVTDTSAVTVYINGSSTRGNVVANEDGTLTFNGTASFNAGTYTVYAGFSKDGYIDAKSDSVSVAFVKPAAPVLTSTPEVENRENGTITIESDYTAFEYYRSGGTTYATSDKTITGLSKDTYYVRVAAHPIEGTAVYNFALQSSNVHIVVDRVDATVTYYTVRFINAAGEEVSSERYAENTAASAVTVPANTADKTVGNVKYTYSWPAVSGVTADTDYNEIETTEALKTVSVKILNIYQNSSSGDYLSFVLSVTDEDNDTISDVNGIKVYVDGSSIRGTVVDNHDSTFTFAGNASIRAGEHTVYAAYSADGYAVARSETKTVSIQKAEKPELSQTPDTNSSYEGTITIESPYSLFAYYRQGTSSEIKTTEKHITGLLGSSEASVSSDYFVYVLPQSVEGSADYNFVTASDKASIKVENNIVDVTVYYTIRFYDAYNYLIQTYVLAEGTSAEDIQTPQNTPENANYRYEWPEIEDVNGNKEYYELRIPKDDAVYDPFVAHSISLKGNIGLNFYLQLEDSVNAEDVTVHFTWGDGKTAGVTLSEDAKSQNGYYRAQVLLPAADQTYEVTAAVTLNGIEYTNSYSIKAYADAILSGNYEDDVKELVKTMLNYGAYAQLQFNRNTDNLANEGLDYDLRSIDESDINAEIPRIDQETLDEYGLRYVGYTLSLKSETVLRFFFSVTDEEKYSGAALSLGDSTEVLTRGDYIYVEIADITANNLDRKYTLSVGGKVLGAYSALSYVKDVLADSSSDERLVNVVTALYRYNEAAKAYFSEQADER